MWITESAVVAKFLSDKQEYKCETYTKEMCILTINRIVCLWNLEALRMSSPVPNWPNAFELINWMEKFGSNAAEWDSNCQLPFESSNCFCFFFNPMENMKILSHLGFRNSHPFNFVVWILFLFYVAFPILYISYIYYKKLHSSIFLFSFSSCFHFIKNPSRSTLVCYLFRVWCDFMLLQFS